MSARNMSELLCELGFSAKSTGYSTISRSGVVLSIRLWHRDVLGVLARKYDEIVTSEKYQFEWTAFTLPQQGNGARS